MASISERKDKTGKIVSYRIRVSRGYDAHGKKLKPYETTFKPEPGATKRQTEKALNAFVFEFEQRCKAGLAGDGRQKFAAFAGYVIDLKQQSGELRIHTANRYRELLVRINRGIGHLKLCDIKPMHLNQLYSQLAQEGIRKSTERAVILPDCSLYSLIHEHGTIEAFMKSAGLSASTYKNVAGGERISGVSARKIAAALDMNVTELFNLETDSRPLSARTILAHHRLIHTILRQAEKEMLIPFNPADRATPPKVPHSRAAYFEPETITAILEAAEQEPLKWKTMLHLLLVTGGRRGELLGLTWDCIDWTFSRIHVEKAVYYDSEKHCVYVDGVKNDSSERWIKLPEVTMRLLKQYRDEYYLPLKAAAGDNWNETGFLFVQDCRNIGTVMHPDTVNDYCSKFSNRYELPHIHPHAFRHTAASVLYFAGVDSITISGMLGHRRVSTTTDIYSHIIQEAENRTAAAMGEIIMQVRRKPPKSPEESGTTGEMQTG